MRACVFTSYLLVPFVNPRAPLIPSPSPPLPRPRSQKCAEKMGILHLVDKRFAGVAVGVGSSKILGKIHLAEMEINGVIFQVTITVMDDSEVRG